MVVSTMIDIIVRRMFPLGSFLHSHGFAFDHIVVANLTANFAKNWNLVWVPFRTESDPALLPCSLPTINLAPGGTSYFSSSRPRGSRIEISPVRFNTTAAPSSFLTTRMRVNFNHPAFLALNSLSSMLVLTETTDVEGTHRQLCTWFTDGLSGDDSNRHTLFDESTGAHIHAITKPADTEWSIAGHRRSNLNLLMADLFDLASDFRSDHLILVDHDFVVEQAHDVLATNASVNRVRQRTSTFSPHDRSHPW